MFLINSDSKIFLYLISSIRMVFKRRSNIVRGIDFDENAGVKSV